MEIIKGACRPKKLEWEIVKILLDNNPGDDFWVNPQEIADDIIGDGFDTDHREVGHKLKGMGFREKMRKGGRGRTYRRINVDLLKKIEYLMLAENDNEYEKIKPLIVYLYHKGYDSTNEILKKFHDKIPEPLRLRVGKWYCQATNEEIETFVSKCLSEGLIHEKAMKEYGD